MLFERLECGTAKEEKEKEMPLLIWNDKLIGGETWTAEK